MLVFRRDAPPLARLLLRRVSRISLPVVTLDVVATPLQRDVWEPLRDLQGPITANLADSAVAIFKFISEGARADFVEVDLGDNGKRAWLTSRLYLLSALAPRVGGVRCLVFLETRTGLPRQFAGLAYPDAVGRSLASHFDWLAKALDDAQVAVSVPGIRHALAAYKPPDPMPHDDRALEDVLRPIIRSGIRYFDTQSWAVNEIGKAYLRHGLIRSENVALPVIPEWVRLGDEMRGGRYDEHGQWIDGGPHLAQLLGDALRCPFVIQTPGTRLRDLQRQAVLRGDDFVAVLDAQGRFDRLLDRSAIVARLARGVAEDEAL